VLLPYNYVTMQNAYYAANFDALYGTCRERNVAIQTIKSIARRPWMGRPHTQATWYEPLQEQNDIDRAVWWALSRPGLFLDSVGDVSLLPKVLDAASRFTGPPSDAAMTELVRQSAASRCSSERVRPVCTDRSTAFSHMSHAVRAEFVMRAVPSQLCR
jgi:hypothetical protein